jgi:hypothetical protein
MVKKENTIVKTIMDAESKKWIECESCGACLSGKNKQRDEYWTCTNNRIVCNDCMFEPLNVLSKVFFAKDFKNAKKIIKDFDEGFDESFLGIEYITEHK